MKKDEQMQEVAQSISEDIQNNNNESAVIALTSVNDRLTASVVGTPSEIVLMLAKTINGSADFLNILKSAIEAAPLVALMYGEGQDAKYCDCPRCTAERAEKFKNVNVN